MKVMIVDDEEMNRELFVDLFEDEEQISDVKCCDNGKDAIEELPSYKPDVIILDVMMPGMDGFETCREIRKIQGSEQVKVIMVTGMTGDDVEKRGMDSGVDSFYFKPINVSTLIKEVLGKNAES